MLGHYDAEFDSTLRVFEGWWHGWHFVHSDGDLNLLNVNRNDDGLWLNTTYDNPGNVWNRENGFAFVVPQLSSFLSHFCEGVLFISSIVESFCKLSAPTA